MQFQLNFTQCSNFSTQIMCQTPTKRKILFGSNLEKKREEKKRINLMKIRVHFWYFAFDCKQLCNFLLVALVLNSNYFIEITNAEFQIFNLCGVTLFL